MALVFLGISLLTVVAPSSLATVSSSLEIPPELSGWKSWVLYGMEEKILPCTL